MKNEIGEVVKIEKGSYEVVKPNGYAIAFIVRTSQMNNIFITSFKMDFEEQEGRIVEEGRAILADGSIIKI